MSPLPDILADIRRSPWPFYVYVLSRPSGEPFYVGKGKGSRVGRHEVEATRRLRSDHKCATIRKIMAGGGAVGYAIDSWHATDDGAAEREKELIAQHGRRDLGTGILTNLTDGGEGIHGWNAAQRARAAERLKRLWADPEYAAKFSQPATAERRAKISVTNKGMWAAPEMRAYASVRSKRTNANPAVKAAQSAASIAMWSDPGFRERMSVQRKAAASNPKRKAELCSFIHTPEAKANALAKRLPHLQSAERRTLMAEKLRARMANPAQRAVALAALERGRAASKVARERARAEARDVRVRVEPVARALGRMGDAPHFNASAEKWLAFERIMQGAQIERTA